MYLFILEDGEIMKSVEFSDEDKDSCDEGVIDVIDISGESPTQYFNGQWHQLRQAGA